MSVNAGNREKNLQIIVTIIKSQIYNKYEFEMINARFFWT